MNNSNYQYVMVRNEYLFTEKVTCLDKIIDSMNWLIKDTIHEVLCHKNSDNINIDVIQDFDDDENMHCVWVQVEFDNYSIDYIPETYFSPAEEVNVLDNDDIDDLNTELAFIIGCHCKDTCVKWLNDETIFRIY